MESILMSFLLWSVNDMILQEGSNDTCVKSEHEVDQTVLQEKDTIAVLRSSVTYLNKYAMTHSVVIKRYLCESVPEGYVFLVSFRNEREGTVTDRYYRAKIHPDAEIEGVEHFDDMIDQVRAFMQYRIVPMTPPSPGFL